MRIYFSGLCNKMGLPEVQIPKERPHVMLSFLDLEKGCAISVTRMLKHQYNVADGKKPKAKQKNNKLDNSNGQNFKDTRLKAVSKSKPSK